PEVIKVKSKNALIHRPHNWTSPHARTVVCICIHGMYAVVCACVCVCVCVCHKYRSKIATHLLCFLSSSGVNTSSDSLPKSHTSHGSDLRDTHTPLSVEQSPDSGIVSTPV